MGQVPAGMIEFEDVGLHYGRPGRRVVARLAEDDGPAPPGYDGPGGDDGPQILRGLTFGVPEGSFRWLTGASGAGKTSLLRLLYLAARPTDGRLVVLGTEIRAARRRELPRLRRQIGVVYQDFRLLPHLSAYDNVALPLRIAGRSEGQVRADVQEMLAWVGLARKLDVPPAALSGGEQQRVAIARAVITRPALLLADEPTGNLDDVQAERLMQLFKEMNRLGTTVIVATHNEALVACHPAPLLHLSYGRLVPPPAPHRQDDVPWAAAPVAGL